MDIHSAHLADTRAGPITVWVSPKGVRRIEFGSLPRGSNATAEDEWPARLREAVGQIREYLDRERRSFELDLDFPDALTDFQRDVYDRLLAIEYGHVVSYGQVARDVGKPDMARAVGQAVGANPIPIVVPCHRVVASDGSLTGFGGGLRAKAELLKLEGIDVTGTTPTSKVHPEVIPLDL